MRNQAAHRRTVAASVRFGEQPLEHAERAEVEQAAIVQYFGAGQPQAPVARADVFQRHRDEDDAGNDRERVLHVHERGPDGGFACSAHCFTDVIGDSGFGI